MLGEQKITPGKQGLQSSGNKIARSGVGVGPRRRIIAAMAALVLLPIETSRAGWLSDVFKGSSKPAKSSKRAVAPKQAAMAKPAASRKHAVSPKHAASPKHVKLAALSPAGLH